MLSAAWARGLLPVSIAQDALAGIGTMHIEAVRKDASPSRTGLVQDYMKIECPRCWVAYHLYHDGLEVKLLRGYFLRASWEISGEHPKHNPVIVFENSPAVAQEKAS